MNSLELEFARKKKGKTKEDMARAIGKTRISYQKKESGEVGFSDEISGLTMLYFATY